MDRQQSEHQVRDVYFKLGGFFEGYSTYSIEIKDGKAAKTYQHPFEETIVTYYTEEETHFIIKAWNELRIESWKENYSDFLIMDGTQWDLVVRYHGTRGSNYSGSNSYPPNWNQLLKLFDIKRKNMDEILKKS